jgi:tripeptide aminopeptidase
LLKDLAMNLSSSLLARGLALSVAALVVCGNAQAQLFKPGPVAPAVDQAVGTLLTAPAVRKVMDDVKADHERSLADLKLLTEIPAPPFKEKARAEAFLARMKALGLADARIDAEGNVVGTRKGAGNGPKLLISAHLDTVFPEGTDVTIKVRDGRWYAPGISDDTRGLAVLLSWLKVLNDNKLQTVGDLMFVGNTGEEELGNLRGIKAIFRDHADIDGMVGLEPGDGGSMIMQGTGSNRYEVTFRGPGGHSFNAFGLPSAIHAMGRAIAKIGDIRTPLMPKTTYTVGTIGGGTSVNTIAGDARMGVDIRSNEMASLLETEKKIMAAIAEGVAEENKRWDSDKISFSTKLIGDRPAGITPPDSRIIQVAVRSLAAFGKTQPVLFGASTDANVPMQLGIPAVIMGSGGKTGNFHARDEWFDPANAWEGAQSSLAAVLALVGVQGVSEPLLEKRAARK